MDKENTSRAGVSSDGQPGKLGPALATDGKARIKIVAADKNNRFNLHFEDPKNPMNIKNTTLRQVFEKTLCAISAPIRNEHCQSAFSEQPIYKFQQLINYAAQTGGTVLSKQQEPILAQRARRGAPGILSRLRINQEKIIGHPFFS